MPRLHRGTGPKPTRPPDDWPYPAVVVLRESLTRAAVLLRVSRAARARGSGAAAPGASPHTPQRDRRWAR